MQYIETMNQDLKLFYQMVKNTRAGVLDWLESLPQSTFLQEHPDFAFGSLRNIYLHIADTYLGWVAEAGLGHAGRVLQADSARDLRQIFNWVDDAVHQALETFTAPDEPRTRTLLGPLNHTQRWLILHPITHEFHHKGQALALARILGHPHPGSPDTDLVPPV
ncbi:DNA damage-inducible protein DinB [Deinococcus cellulosilyticus NBRC 106333 = KACC 11606]|uniref:DNA damage-inducible protein DinB n=1 Tax=Deinococcus cellulosilyticus (strain DSM 18568 / NBRC 106333 / KACC 11606 / 5516J-15) TaxID=1223518 RepID=A0A511N9W2_DEIC1|nr:DNA damage-inducible protein DinB [Deinococcus cellulosilyticus NBRC 106333 = KACC 11606]